jgi:Domain of unknown function (DUF4384)
MIAAFALALLLPTTAPAAPVTGIDDPPIRIKLSHDTYERGDRARVRVKTAKDGYLLVVRQDANGRIRVLYPLSPDDEGRVQGGKEFEIRSRGDREAFAVDESTGSGTVLAVRSDNPFEFTDFTRSGHWDYRALSDSGSRGDAESTLLDLVDHMTSTRYDYDLVDYTVTSGSDARYYSAGWYDPWYVGSFYPCFVCGRGFYGPRFGFRVGFGFGHGHFRGGRRR